MHPLRPSTDLDSSVRKPLFASVVSHFSEFLSSVSTFFFIFGVLTSLWWPPTLSPRPPSSVHTRLSALLFSSPEDRWYPIVPGMDPVPSPVTLTLDNRTRWLRWVKNGTITITVWEPLRPVHSSRLCGDTSNSPERGRSCGTPTPVLISTRLTRRIKYYKSRTFVKKTRWGWVRGRLGRRGVEDNVYRQYLIWPRIVCRVWSPRLKSKAVLITSTEDRDLESLLCRRRPPTKCALTTSTGTQP